MKKNFFTLLFSLSLLSCNKTLPIITPESDAYKVFPTQMKQKVLIENFVSEFLEKSVTNSFFVNTLEEKYGNSLIFCNVHKQDWLETPFTSDLITLLGGFIYYPRAAINRLNGNNTQGEDGKTMLDPINWESTIERALQEEPTISLAVKTAIDKDLKGSVELYIAHKEAILQDTRIGLYMVEDNIQSLFQQGANDNFLHQHVMKNALLPVQGEPIQLTNEVPQGEILIKQFSDIELKLYHLNNAHLVAFIFNYDADYKKIKVLNAIKVKFGANKFWNE